MVHIIINNAAHDDMRPMGQLDDAYVHNCLLGNIHVLVMTIEALYKGSMIQPDSRIVNVSAVAHRVPLPFP
jgi:3-oxoacyl-[acyl-carrier protein] reductase